MIRDVLNGHFSNRGIFFCADSSPSHKLIPQLFKRTVRSYQMGKSAFFLDSAVAHRVDVVYRRQKVESMCHQEDGFPSIALIENSLLE
jgi:hypothetical protein